MGKKLLVISFFAKRKGCCPAEWLDDKVDAMLKLGHRVVLVSSLWSEKFDHPQVEHYRIPSISPKDFKMEFDEVVQSGEVPWKAFFWIPLILFVGLPLDLLQYFITNGLGGGKWSWTLSSFFTGFYILLNKKFDLLITTGGPASAHLSGVALGKIFRLKVVSELQDPLSGEGIGRNSRSAKGLFYLERMLIKHCLRVVYVTKRATKEARDKFNNSKNIQFLYPGSRKFNTRIERSTNEKFTMIHLGTLYSTRNMDTLIEGIEILLKEGKIKENEIEIINLGEIYGDYKFDYLKKKYFQQRSILPREEAINFASSCDLSLLIQHTDERSSTTIPYKTYDYLNIENPILGLVNSEELSQLLLNHGHFSAAVDNPLEIANKIYSIFLDRRHLKKVNIQGMDILKQTSYLIEG